MQNFDENGNILPVSRLNLMMRRRNLRIITDCLGLSASSSENRQPKTAILAQKVVQPAETGHVLEFILRKHWEEGDHAKNIDTYESTRLNYFGLPGYPIPQL
jgi:hypothetical protein|tara:strand:- start:110 stop:415 length:306 start_codon:yes stop_codon:yes gene_type:complete